MRATRLAALLRRSVTASLGTNHAFSRSCSSKVTELSAEEQQERIRLIKQRAVDAATPRKMSDDTLGRILSSVLSVAATAGLCGFGYLYWKKSCHTAAMKKFLEEKEAQEGVVKRPSGLMYRVLKKGNGTQRPTRKSSCLCRYRGTLTDGTEFDSSDTPRVFVPRQLEIQGWMEALLLMVEGDIWELYIPPELAYGNDTTESIPGGSVIVFSLELVRITTR
eukprot:gnl/MRDRNA2_/MRDRNA2_153801_c0_seq1.p1 gnl/MRDRNA2_/MRDRNA2_153801_c0~~gnl/MRDRNA2_/MRDRNA2_153801_c0_seq1.p1  ORF type:complete len:221 (+),score=40.93 gnl/MRDRNA2_/MRDRNA2_153801_c0_seq1:82-744(+)